MYFEQIAFLPLLLVFVPKCCACLMSSILDYFIVFVIHTAHAVSILSPNVICALSEVKENDIKLNAMFPGRLIDI